MINNDNLEIYSLANKDLEDYLNKLNEVIISFRDPNFNVPIRINLTKNSFLPDITKNPELGKDSTKSWMKAVMGMLDKIKEEVDNIKTRLEYKLYLVEKLKKEFNYE